MRAGKLDGVVASASPVVPPDLLLRLLGGELGVLEGVGLPSAMAERLKVVCAGEPVVDWFGVNERRVDAVVSTTVDEYRIVYFTDDGVTIDSVFVWRRPPRFDGVDGGRVVVVNGPSGSGKSSLLSAIASVSELPWVVFDEPVIGAVDDRYLIWRGQAPGLHRGFVAAIGALARCGNLVAFSAAGHPAPAVDEALRDLDVVRVGLDCDLETLRARELGRDGRWGGLAEGSMSDHDGWRYDLRFDTTRSTPTEIAAALLRHVTLPTSTT